MLGVGLENCIGDVVVTMNPLEDSLDLIGRAYKISLGGSDIIVGKTKYKETILYKIVSIFARPIMKVLLGYQTEANVSNFKLLSRGALNLLLKRKRHLSQINFTLTKTFKNIHLLSYESRSDVRVKKFTEGVKHFLNIVVLNSTSLLKVFNLVGLLGSFLAFIISLYVIGIKLVTNNVVEGWTSLSLFISIQFLILFFILFIYGSYLVRLVEEIWQKREYEILSEHNSSVMFNDLLRNVVSDEN